MKSRFILCRFLTFPVGYKMCTKRSAPPNCKARTVKRKVCSLLMAVGNCKFYKVNNGDITMLFIVVIILNDAPLQKRACVIYKVILNPQSDQKCGGERRLILIICQLFLKQKICNTLLRSNH